VKLVDEAFVMTEHVTISLDAEHLKRARREALRLGVSLESYLSSLVHDRLPVAASADQHKPQISAIFGIGASVDPTDIGRDKDIMVGEAVWKEHLRKTRQIE
jgi:hypothetical protein